MIELTKFEAGFLFVTTKLINTDPDLIDKFEIDQKRLKIYPKWSNLIEKYLLIVFFDLLINYKVIFFDLFIDYKVIFFDLLIKNRSILIKNRSHLIQKRSIWYNMILFWPKIRSLYNCHPNLDGLESESSTIWFRRPNGPRLLVLECWNINTL